MEKGIKRLCQVAQKSQKKILGLMSGTSLDGLDLALCQFTGNGPETKVQVLNFTTRGYDEEFKNHIRAVFSKRTVDLQWVCILNEYIGKKHASIINEVLKEWDIDNKDIDVIASHGQTIYHAPAALHQIPQMPNATLQIGDGDHIALETGIITLSDFRQKHIAAGGEGAPLAVYGDYLIFSEKGESRIMLNIGGISNFTYLPADLNSAKVLSTDCGPGNTMMDAFIRENFKGKNYDENGLIASSGTVNQTLLNELMKHPFFNLPLPKTTGPELFNLDYFENAAKNLNENLSPEDVVATLNYFTAQAIFKTIKQLEPDATYSIYISGGGAHNPVLIKNIRKLLPGVKVDTTSRLGIHPDAKEAVLFAALANECLSDNITAIGAAPAVRMGKISLPD